MSDLHALLDSLTDGEHVKATWRADQIEITAEGPICKDGLHCSCFHVIRWRDGSLTSSLTSLEVTRDEEVTVTRDDEEALKALLDSLETGDTVTAEWGNGEGSMNITGQAIPSDAQVVVRGPLSFALRFGDGILHSDLRSATVRRTVVQRWEREGNE